MKILIASDSFKGTFSSLDICFLIKKEFSHNSNFEFTCLPIADGGEGSLEAIASNIKGRFISLKTNNPYFRKIKTKYFLDEFNNAYIEVASSAGLNLIKNLNPLKTSTYGVGEQVLDALKKDAKKIYIFLGGSATNDGGCGLFSALGTKFYNELNEEFIPTGGTLKNITKIDNSLTTKLLKNIEVIGMCDVNNPLYGLNGAAYIYAPQKGATKEDVLKLDEGLKHLDSIIKKDLKKDISLIEGAGAAGGIGASILAFSNGILKKGIEEILNILNFDQLIKDVDYVITGEGKLDKQSFYGKVISGVATHALKHNKNLILLVGSSEITLEEAQTLYPCIKYIFETNPNHLPFNKVKKHAKVMYSQAIHKLLIELLNK